MSRQRKYTDAQRAMVIASLLAGNTPSYVAKEMDMPLPTVKSWKAKIPTELIHSISQKNELNLAGKVVELLNAQLDMMLTQTRAMSDVEWVHSQTASDMAILFGTSYDKIMRIAEMLDSGDSNTAKS